MVNELPKPNKGDWGIRLREFRLLKGLSQTELARRSGLSPSHVSRSEGGAFDLTSVTSGKLAAGFGISKEWLNDYLQGLKESYQPSFSEVLEMFNAVKPVVIPVYAHFPFIPRMGIEAVNYIYKDRSEGILHGSLAYIINSDISSDISAGDTIIVDPSAAAVNGQLWVCMVKGQIFVGTIRGKTIERERMSHDISDCRHLSQILQIIKDCRK